MQAVICNGKTVSDQVRLRLKPALQDAGTLELITWWVGSAEVDGRRVGLAGWNKPLHQPTGLGAAGEQELGQILREKLGL
jgi:hypothetical protein